MSNQTSSTKSKTAIYEFITSTGDPEVHLNDPKVTKTIRSHVMRRFRYDKKRQKKKEQKNRKQALLKARHKPLQFKLSLRFERSQPHKFRQTDSLMPRDSWKTFPSAMKNRDNTNTLVHGGAQKYSSLTRYLPGYLPEYVLGRLPIEKHQYSFTFRRNMIDSVRPGPFKSLPTNGASDLDYLTEFCSYVISNWTQLTDNKDMWQYPHVNPPKAFVHRMLSSPITTQALLMSASVIYRVHVRDWAFAASQHHRNVAITIRVVNEALNDPHERYGDAVVAAITLLAMNELTYGNFMAYNSHLSAIQTIVRVRGGIQALGWNGMLAKLIVWVDNSFSTITFGHQRFPVTISPRSETGGGITINDAPSIQDISKVKPASILAFLKAMCEEAVSQPLIHSDRFFENYSEKVLRLDHQLSTCILQRVHNSNGRQHYCLTDNISHCFYIAAVMFLYLVLREQPLRHQVFAVLLRELRDTLAEVRSVSHIYSVFEVTTGTRPILILLWVALAGGVCGESGPYEAYFRERVFEIASFLKVDNWEQAREILSEIAWVPRTCEQRWNYMWKKCLYVQRVPFHIAAPWPVEGWNNFEKIADSG